MNEVPTENKTACYRNFDSQSGNISAPPLAANRRLIKSEPNYILFVEGNQPFQNSISPQQTRIRKFKEKWHSSLVQLAEALRVENYNGDVDLPSSTTTLEAITWLLKSYAFAPALHSPDVVPDGEGGIDIEWTIAEKFVSIHIDKSKPAQNRIFVKDAEGYFSKPLNDLNLKKILGF